MVVICSKFITFAVTKTTAVVCFHLLLVLWFAQNSLPLRWQRQQVTVFDIHQAGCDLLKIHYLCGDKDNRKRSRPYKHRVVICSKFITFAVTKTTRPGAPYDSEQLWFAQNSLPLRWQRQLFSKFSCHPKRCDLLKIHYLCGDKDNLWKHKHKPNRLWFAQNSLPLRWQRQLVLEEVLGANGCDLLKIHYLCGDKDNQRKNRVKHL